MALLSLLFVLVQSLIQYPQPAGDGLDEATRRRMQEREELLEREMARLLQELEQGPPEQQDEGWGALLFGTLQQWPFWALAGLLLLLGLWFSRRRRTCEANSSGKEQSSCKTLREEKEEDGFDSKADGENIDMTVEAEDSGSANEGEGSPVAANEREDNDANERDEDVKLKKDSDIKSADGHDARIDEGWSDENLPGDNTAEGNEEEPGNDTGNTEDLDEANEGENKDVKVEPDQDAGKEEEGDVNEEKTNDAYMKAGTSDDVREGEDGKEEKADVKVQESSDWIGPEDNDAYMKAGNSDDVGEGEDGKEEKADVKVQESSEASEQRSSDWIGPEDNDAYMKAGNSDDVGEGEDGKEEKADVKVQESSEASEQRSSDWIGPEDNDAYMKAGNSDDVGEGEDGKEEKADVKVQESSEASEQRSSDWIGPEDNSAGGKAVDHSRFAATVERNTDPGNDEINAENRNEKKGDENVKGEKNEDGKEDERVNVAASEKEGSNAGKDKKGGRGGIEEEEDTRGIGNKRGILLVDRIRCPVEDLERGCSVTAELMESLTRVFVDSVSNSFYPVPQEAIGVGSAFEGWSPHDQDMVFRVLVPLNPPPGHAFHLKLNRAGQMAARTFCVRVELVCTCKREQLGEKLLCFLHSSQKELRRKQKPSLLETLCTGSYLDVEKTSHWFYQLVRCSWLQLPQSYSWHLVFQPCRRSCQFRLSKGKKSLMVEMLFGVRHGDSDIFVVSQPTEAQKGGSSISVSSQPAEADSISSTAWPETYAVAEAKFFQHIARQVPYESLHLKCLQVFTCILRGTGFSSSTWKTVLMHVLTTVPPSQWRRREFVRRLWDIMAYLRRCLQSKRLDHFVLGNKRLPAEISLPPAVRRVKPLNLFEHLARDPAAHREAMRAYGQLRFRLWTLLSSH